MQPTPCPTYAARAETGSPILAKPPAPVYRCDAERVKVTLKSRNDGTEELSMKVAFFTQFVSDTQNDMRLA